MYRPVAHASTRATHGGPLGATLLGPTRPVIFHGSAARFKSKGGGSVVRRVARPPSSQAKHPTVAATGAAIRAPSSIFPISPDADDPIEAAVTGGDAIGLPGVRATGAAGSKGTEAQGVQMVQVTARDLFPPESMIKLWQSRPPSASGVALKVSSSSVQDIVAKLDGLLEGKTASEAVHELGKAGLDAQCQELRAVHADARQWTLVAQLLLAHNSFNVHRSYLLYELARHAGDFTAEYAVARMYLKEKSPAKLESAKSLLTSLAQRGHPQAQLTLGGVYAADRATSAKALSLFETAGANGILLGWVEAGRLHLHLDQPDLARAQFTKAARAGEPRGHFYLAQMCAKEDKDDWPQVVEHLTRAAEGGVPEAQHNLGMMYLQGRPPVGESGKRLVKDAKRAKQWLELAAARGFWPSMFNLALVLRMEQGREAKARARELLVKCANVKGKFGEEAQRELDKMDKEEANGGTRGGKGCVIM